MKNSVTNTLHKNIRLLTRIYHHIQGGKFTSFHDFFQTTEFTYDGTVRQFLMKSKTISKRSGTFYWHKDKPDYRMARKLYQHSYLYNKKSRMK